MEWSRISDSVDATLFCLFSFCSSTEDFLSSCLDYRPVTVHPLLADRKKQLLFCIILNWRHYKTHLILFLSLWGGRRMI